MKKNIIILCVIWTAITAASFIWNLRNESAARTEIMLKGARSNFQQIVLFRIWNAGHGGVYVPVTDDTQPNPYLQTPQRDIRISSTMTLTKVNPAFMTRQVSEIALKKEGIKFHITSLNPIRPDNNATPIEEKALKSFEAGQKESSSILKTGGNNSFFYMAPLITERSCLSCHAQQGYREGDIRGGISITFPFMPSLPYGMLAGGHLFILLAGITGIAIAGRKLTKAYEIIQRQAVFDALTGIPNRHSFSQRLLAEYNRSKRNSSPLSIIMGDVDHFKLFNDTYGHSEGDSCLRSVAQAIEKSLKRPGDFCARYGGEEFIIILPDTTISGAAAIAEEIRKNVEALRIPHEKSQPYGVVTISLGGASRETHNTMSHEELLKQADSALYIAKNKGRNRFDFFTEAEGSRD